jgi:hypothetical protein
MTDVERLNALIQAGMPTFLAMAVVDGKMTEVEAEARVRLSRAADKLRRLAAKRWPRVEVVWDLDPVRFHRAMDDHTAESFAAAFPDVVAASVGRLELQENLRTGSRREKGPLSRAYKSKTAGLVAYLQSGGAVTPPFLRLCPDGLAVVGGNHRLGWAHHCEQDPITILVEIKDWARLQARLASLTRL